MRTKINIGVSDISLEALDDIVGDLRKLSGMELPELVLRNARKFQVQANDMVINVLRAGDSLRYKVYYSSVEGSSEQSLGYQEYTLEAVRKL